MRVGIIIAVSFVLVLGALNWYLGLKPKKKKGETAQERRDKAARRYTGD
jgi:hypothetical protein